MRTVSKVTYWIAGFVGTAIWTSAIIAVSNLPLPTQLALGAMGLVGCVWGHAVLFPRDRPVGEPSAPGRMPRAEAMRAAEAAAHLPLGIARVPVSRPPRTASLPPGDLPPLLRLPFEEAARMEAHRLAEAITAAGLFGPVNVRLEADGSAVIAPVQSSGGVRIPAAKLVRFAAYAAQPDGLAQSGRHGAGTWPGQDVLAAIDAHLAAIAPPMPPATRPAAAVPGPAAPQQPGTTARLAF
ncbi:hypothetical protein [Falsiroseomonas selenitidurans]|uniref:Uncharacterized protein n=1 Tax=Falsiroseomonas selenitidurans TaxID=2716335 RepID=A0ABX1E649_9PROT|nr:hypothetical protein [Falsiroseomonas selenitidurans]NKC30415.1 hypothetical protein [Falsiroseomonas selenitidurans]